MLRGREPLRIRLKHHVGALTNEVQVVDLLVDDQKKNGGVDDDSSE